MKYFFEVAFTITISVFLMNSCTDLYEPDITVKMNYMVVEGLITDEPGPHLVKLSKSREFGKDKGTIFVENAELRIVDSNNNEIFLQESENGHYYTPETFAGEIGESYILHIETNDGKKFKSKPQKIIAPVSIDSVFGEIDSQLFFFESAVSDELYQRDIDGSNVYLNVSRSDNNYPKFRFTSILMLQYSYSVPSGGGGAPAYEYCWVRRRITDFVDADIVKNLTYPDSKRNRIAFIPLASNNMRFFGFPAYVDDSTLINYQHPRILIKSIYTLNDDAYMFHYERNKQLDDEGTFFDPISPQLTGNLYNVNDSEYVVLGFFEASSITRRTINVRPQLINDVVEIDTLDCLHHVPPFGCSFDELPEWWI